MAESDNVYYAPLGEIDDNPSIKRPIDPRHVQNLATDIQANQLHEYPAGRLRGNRVELAFGHHRKAAYELLTQQGVPGFDKLPVVIRDYSDEAMFSAGLSENLKRRDLTPMQRARAMLTASKLFGWSSRKLGIEFAEDDKPLTGGAVRNVIALTRLPLPIQEMIDAGKITELEGRRLVGLARIDPEASKRAAKSIAEGVPVDTVVADALRTNPLTTLMWDPMLPDAGKIPMAGPGMWPFNWTPGKDELAPLEWHDVYHIKQLGDDKRIFAEVASRIAGGEDADILVDAGFDETLVEIIAQLLEPGVCTKCPWHLTLNGRHWCALKYCHERKSNVWSAQKLTEVSEKTGLPPYDPDTDGLCRPLYKTYGGKKGRDEIVFDKRSPHLRLRIQPLNQNHPFTDSPLIEVVDVSPDTQQLRTEDLPDGFRRTEVQASRELQETEEGVQKSYEHQLENASFRFLWEVASSVFATVNTIASVGLLKFQSTAWLQYSYQPPEPEPSVSVANEVKISYYRRRIMFAVLRMFIDQNHKDAYLKGPRALLAKALPAAAVEFGVTLPDNFADLAATYEPLRPEAIKGKRI
jgi:ParB-like chromosome segregation protein Spo0J